LQILKSIIFSGILFHIVVLSLDLFCCLWQETTIMGMTGYCMRMVSFGCKGTT